MVEGFLIIAILLLILFAVVNINANHRLHESHPELKRIVKLKDEIDSLETGLNPAEFEEYLIMCKDYLINRYDIREANGEKKE